jgi:iron complex outermembrane receptor protein
LAREQQRGAGFYTAESDYPDPESLLEQWQAINTTTWHATDTLTFKNIASYAQLRDTLNSALFGTDWPLVPGAPPLEFAFIQSAPGDWGTLGRRACTVCACATASAIRLIHPR